MKREEELTVSVKIKPLEWEEKFDCFTAENAFGQLYSFWNVDTGRFECNWLDGSFPTPESAKKALQEEHDRRIRSALLPTPKPEAEPVAWRWRDTEHEAWNHINWEPVHMDYVFVEPLYAHPPKPEPVAKLVSSARKLIEGLDSEAYISSETCVLINHFDRDLEEAFPTAVDAECQKGCQYSQDVGMTEYQCAGPCQYKERIISPSHPPKPEATEGGTHEKGQEVISLVIAVREFWDIHNDLSAESAALDKALEPFSSVPFENEPDEVGQ